MQRRQRALTPVATVVYLAAVVIHFTSGWGGDVPWAVATILWGVVLSFELRRGRGLRAAARQREQDFYAARRNGASGAEAWISSGQAAAAAELRASRRGSV